MKRALSALALALVVSLPAAAVELATSNFNTDAEGWRALNGVAATGWAASGGVSGGYFWAADSGGGVIWVFDAPAAYLGDQTAALGGTLSFSLIVSTLAAPMASQAATVRFIGGGLTLAANAGGPPGLDWTPYTLPLLPSSFHVGDLSGPVATAADLSRVFSSVTSLRIRGEYSQLRDRGGIDNVVMSPVPEPATAALMLLGAAGLAGWRRRRG